MLVGPPNNFFCCCNFIYLDFNFVSVYLYYVHEDSGPGILNIFERKKTLEQDAKLIGGHNYTTDFGHRFIKDHRNKTCFPRSL